ncbi:uncharacterized protein LOC114535327 [Dendronephthya gigantea]|uniref:uncharacterized protein LOC114535327 n=1 Tax=Dendronephthya gigantea TaxID=151771 RepID=UPI001068EC90|nr:uncharacterized protein LOC114535327 [Dendronephthya gigantea]
MAMFNVGDAVEALDEVSVWSKGKIIAKEGENFVISFDGFGSMWDVCVSPENVRPVTVVCLPRKRSRNNQNMSESLKKVQAGDEIYVRGNGKVNVVQVDPINGKLMVEVDGTHKQVGVDELCPPPQLHPQKRNGNVMKGKRANKKRRREETPLFEESEHQLGGEVAMPTGQFMPYLYLMRDDGTKGIPQRPPVYRIAGYDKDELQGTFYKQELQEVNKTDSDFYL